MIRLSLCAACLALAAAAFAGDELPRGQWKCVALDPTHLAMTGNYMELQDRLFRQRLDIRRKTAVRELTGWAEELNFYLAGTEAIAAYRPKVTAMLRDRPEIRIAAAKPLAVNSTGYWLSPIGQSRFMDDKTKKPRMTPNADAAHYLFLTLDRPLTDGEKITITLPAGETVEWTFRSDAPSPLFKINQVGYLPDARKYAYVGAWLGTAGPLALHGTLDGKPFQLVNAADRKPVFSGKLKARMPDPTNASGSPFTGEEVLELDFSDVTAPGTYFLVIPGVARSDTFRIGDDTMAEAFFIHARGLYHQRCGIAKQEPYSPWIQPACHQSSIRGNFPPETRHYGKSSGKRAFGFTDASGKSVQVNHFELIKRNPPLAAQELHFPAAGTTPATGTAAPSTWASPAIWPRSI